MIKLSPYTYISLFKIYHEMIWSGWEVNEYLFGIIIIYKKPFFK